MYKHLDKSLPNPKNTNKGIALPIILVLLLVMTILGVTALSQSTLQERMTASQRLRGTAFNAAEATLREGEARAKAVVNLIKNGNLPTALGGTTRLFASSDGTPPTPDWTNGWPSASAPNPGDTCTGGYCTPLEYDLSGTNPTEERWLDANLNVWNDTSKHLVYSDYEDVFGTNGIENVFEAPKFIIEFLGQFPTRTNPSDPATATSDCSPATPVSVIYPFCDSDPYYFRITARVVVGNAGRQSVVMLQSTVVTE